MNRPRRASGHRGRGRTATWVSCVLALVLAVGGAGALWFAQDSLVTGQGQTLPVSAESQAPSEEEASQDQEESSREEDSSSAPSSSQSEESSREEIRTKALAAVTEADLDWLSQSARDGLVDQMVDLPEDQWDSLIAAQEEQKPVPPTREEAQAAIQGAGIDWLDSSGAEALITQLLAQDKSQWESTLAAQVSDHEAALLRQQAEEAVDEGDLAWMTDDQREKLISQLLAQPTQNWAGIIGGQETARLEAAQQRMDDASLSWLTQEDWDDFAQYLAGESSDDWDALIQEKEAERDDYVYDLAEAMLDDYDDLDWLTGQDREDFLQELVEMRRGLWQDAMEEKALEEPVEEEDEDDGDYDSSGEWGELTVTAGTYDAYELVCRIVAAEMGRWTNQEALKAQALAAYSYVKYENSQGRTPSVALGSPTSAIKKAVSAVEGEMITYNNRVAFTTYFSISSGRTNNASDVWGGHYDYLVSVDSAIDKKADGYEREYTFDEDEMRDMLEDALDIELEGDPEDWIDIRGHNDGDYVTSVRIDGQKTVSGRYLRESVLGIRSSAFDVEYDDGEFLITTYGYGHGVGMSQWGAYLYATQKGWDYEEIIEHYYPGTRVR